MRTYSYALKPPTENAARAWNQLERAHRYYNVLIGLERERRSGWRAAVASAKENPELADKLETTKKEIQERLTAAVRVERARCGVHWGTYLVVEDAAQRSAKDTPMNEDPKFRPWTQHGSLAVQLQNGLPAPVVLDGDDTNVRVVGTGKRRVLWLRIGSEGRRPVWATWPMFYHRDLPAEAIVKWVRVSAHKVATHIEWNVQFVLDSEHELNPLPSPTKGSVAIDVGWRLLPHGVRVATWRDDSGESGELCLSTETLDRMRKVDDLQSIRAKNSLEAGDDLGVFRHTGMDTWPGWLLDATRHQMSSSKLSTLAIKWRANRFEGDARVYEPLEAWRKQDRHLHEWQENQRESVLRARREQYRLFAVDMAQYRRVVVERLDLRAFSRRPAENETEEPSATNSRGRRFQACLSQRFSCLADAVVRAGGEWREVEPAWSTQSCSHCGRVEPFDASADVMHTCAHCGATWDQDVNAAINLLSRAAQPEQLPARRSRAKVLDLTLETKAQARRRKSLETRRARRSQTAV